jgi:hypothetical protein
MPSTQKDLLSRLRRARHGSEGVLHGQRAELVLPRAASQQPHLRLTPGLKPSANSPRIVKVSVFTNTTKMRAGSFSLPAGPPKVGGTCPAAAARPAGVAERDWICHGCYATTGNYQLPSVQTAQLVRRAWVWAALSDGTLVEQLDAALRVFLAHPRRAVVLGPDGKTHRVELHPGYFRLHDSGDFSWAGPEYALAWFEVCRAFPEVLFWAPTRDWIFGPMREVFRRRPHNLALRPSALTVGADAPSASGMSAGTTVMERAGELVAHDCATGGHPSPEQLWDCPAYRCEGHSCETASCRTCWDKPDVPVNYAPHGSIVKIKANPRASLESMFDAYQRTRANGEARDESGRIFEAFLADNGRSPASFDEGAWRSLLTREGVVDFDDQTSYLESAAEW